MTIDIKSKNKTGMYENYIQFLHPIFKVTPQEREVLAHLMMRYNDIATEVNTIEYINLVLFNTDTRNNIAKTLDISPIRYNGILTKFRTMGLVKGKTLVNKIVPRIKNGIIQVKVNIHEEKNEK
jgi:hypothetical protein